MIRILSLVLLFVTLLSSAKGQTVTDSTNDCDVIFTREEVISTFKQGKADFINSLSNYLSQANSTLAQGDVRFQILIYWNGNTDDIRIIDGQLSCEDAIQKWLTKTKGLFTAAMQNGHPVCSEQFLKVTISDSKVIDAAIYTNR